MLNTTFPSVLSHESDPCCSQHLNQWSKRRKRSRVPVGFQQFTCYTYIPLQWLPSHPKSISDAPLLMLSTSSKNKQKTKQELKKLLQKQSLIALLSSAAPLTIAVSTRSHQTYTKLAVGFCWVQHPASHSNTEPCTQVEPVSAPLKTWNRGWSWSRSICDPLPYHITRSWTWPAMKTIMNQSLCTHPTNATKAARGATRCNATPRS